MVPTSTDTPDWLEPGGWWGWRLVTSPPANQKNVHKLITQAAALSLTLSLKTFPWKPLGVWVFWAPSTWTPCLAPAIKASLSRSTAWCQQVGFTSRGWADPSLVCQQYQVTCCLLGSRVKTRPHSLGSERPCDIEWGICHSRSFIRRQ